MGYQTLFRGELKIDPPLSQEEFAALPEEVKDWEVHWPYRLEDETTIVSFEDDAVRAYSHAQSLQTLVDLLCQSIPTRVFLGYVYGEGETQGDVWRSRVVDGTVVTEKAKLIWEDGSPAGLPDYH